MRVPWPFHWGLMWQALGQEARVFERDVRSLPPWTWGPMDGACVHSCTPHFGQRVSLVLFTQECILRPLPERLSTAAAALGVASVSTVSWEQFSVLGMRALAREEDWRLTAALSEVAEAVLHVSQLPNAQDAKLLPRDRIHRSGAKGSGISGEALGQRAQDALVGEEHQRHPLAKVRRAAVDARAIHGPQVQGGRIRTSRSKTRASWPRACHIKPQ